MYNIVTLLTEEPKKIEKIILIFLKLLVVLFVGNEIFEYQFSMKTSLDDVIPTNYTISRGIFFLMSLVIVWYIVWTVIADLIIGELIVWILSRKPIKRETFMYFLDWFKVIEQKGHAKSSYVMPDKNVITFHQMLNSYDEEDDQFIREGKARVQEYYVISIIIYCTLLFAKDIVLPTVLVWFGAMMIANFLILAVVINKVYKYLISNLDV